MTREAISLWQETLEALAEHEMFIDLVEHLEKWDEVMSARTWVIKHVKSNETQRGNA